MKEINQLINVRHRTHPSWQKKIIFLLAGVLVCSTSPLVADTTDSGAALPSGAPSSGVYSAPAASLSPTTSTSTGNAPAWQGGHLPFLVSVSLSEVYDDNIFIQPKKTSDEITQINLRGEYRIGDRAASDGNFLDVFYSPAFDLYANQSNQDSFNQLVGVLYQHRFSKLDLGLEQDYSKQSSTSAAAGTLVTSDIYTTTGTADYAYSDRLSLTGNVTQTVTGYEATGFSSSNEWVGNTYFLYKLDSKLSVGLGPAVGFLDIGAAPNQTFEQILGHVDYRYSRKLSFSLSAGAEDRQYQGSATGDKISPVFTLAGTYHPFIDTTLTLSGSRSYQPSYNTPGQDYLDTNVSLTASQLFLQKFTYNLGLGYENDGYEAAGIVLTGPTRSDDYFYATTSVGWNPNKWMMTSIFYKYQKDDSNLAAATFDDNQVGLSLSLSY